MSACDKVLLAFDFDHTIIEVNSDYHVRKLAPGGVIPHEIVALHSDEGWTKCMAEIFRYLHENSVKPKDILDCMSEVGFTSGMVELFENLNMEKVDIIIISDANSVFIDHILETNGRKNLFHSVFTNPAFFDENGRLSLEGYHVQDHCTLSTKNLCKGQILEDFITARRLDGIKYSLVGYIGDGMNDFCPGLKLSEVDLFFPRQGFSLVKYIQKMETEQGLKVRAELCLWNTGLDILEKIKEKRPDVIKS